MSFRCAAALTFALAAAAPAVAQDVDERQIARAVMRHVALLVPANGADGAAVVVQANGRTTIYSFGMADQVRDWPVTPDSLFSLGSVAKTFEALLLAQAVLTREVALDDPVAKYVPELQQSGDIRRVTLGQLAAFTSGLLLKQDYPPWPTETFTEESNLARLKEWRLEKGRHPGKQVMHVQSGFLLRLALQRRLGMPYGELIRHRILDPLRLTSTTLPEGPCCTAAWQDSCMGGGAGGAGLGRRRHTDRGTREPAGLLPLARNWTDVFLGARHGRAPRCATRGVSADGAAA